VAVTRSVPGDKAVRNHNRTKIAYIIRRYMKADRATSTNQGQQIINLNLNRHYGWNGFD
jgi:hypothetical protein